MTLGKGIEQLCVFAIFWAISVIICVIFLFVSKLCKNQLSTIIADALLGFCFVLLYLHVNLHTNNGEPRLFLFFAMILGYLSGYFCFNRTLDKLSSKLYNLFTNSKVDENGKTIL